MTQIQTATDKPQGVFKEINELDKSLAELMERVASLRERLVSVLRNDPTPAASKEGIGTNSPAPSKSDLSYAIEEKNGRVHHILGMVRDIHSRLDM